MSWCLQELTVLWVPPLQVVSPIDFRQCFLLDTASLEDSIATSHTSNSLKASWYLKRPVDISIFTSDFPWAPFILLFGGTRAWTISGGHSVLDGCFCKVRCKCPPYRKKEAQVLLEIEHPPRGCSDGAQGWTFFCTWAFPSDIWKYTKRKERSPFFFSSFRDLYFLDLFCYVCCISLLCCKQKMTEPHVYWIKNCWKN